MRRKLGSILTIEDLAILAKLADRLKSILETELARRAAKDKVRWDDIRSDIKGLGSEFDIALMRSWTKSPFTPPKQLVTILDIATMVMEQIRKRS